ncbi:hypothetical protein JCM1841_006376 [Sporobolomyces salmonicolor]
MDESWSWDGSLVSLNSSISSSGSASPRLQSRAPSTRSLADSVSLPPPAALSSSSPEHSPLRASPRASPPASLALGPMEPSGTTTPHSDPSSTCPSPPPLQPASSSPSALPSDKPHPLASILLADLSPPGSPTSLSSFPRSSRVSSCGASASGQAGRSGRGRTRARRGSAGSMANTDGSAHTSDEAGMSSAEEGGGGSGGGLVMPSLTFDSAAAAAGVEARETEHGPNIRLLVLGKTSEDRRTLATLLSSDDDLHQTSSGRSATGGTDMSYSFFSTQRSDRSRATSAQSVDQEQGPSQLEDSRLFVELGSCGSTITLFHHATEGFNTAALTGSLLRPLEQLEAKLNRTYPSTESLSSLVAAVGCGDFDACLFLCSSPLLPSELALARPISHLLPIFPVLILPPSPTSKPQKTTALSNAVTQQLDSAGVRWLSAFAFERRSDRSPPRRAMRKRSIGGGPLYMLPHDLFVQHPPIHPHVHPAPSSSHPTTSAPSPSSEPGALSLSSSQELLLPPSPTLTTTSSLRSSSRASSTRSSSPAGHHSTLLDLHRLRRLMYSIVSPAKLRKARAITFLEWREVEVAARGCEVQEVERLPESWKERRFEGVESEDDLEGGGSGGRRALDFSKRVAERRKALRAKEAVAGRSRTTVNEANDEDVLDETDDDEADAQSGGGATGRRRSSFADPATPKCAQRLLPVFSSISNSTSSSASTSPKEALQADDEFDPGYFPPYPAVSLRPSSISPPPSSLPPDNGLSSSAAVSETSSSLASSLLVLRGTDPFYLPSLLHLVGLNLRLALFHPASSASRAGSRWPRKDTLASRDAGRLERMDGGPGEGKDKIARSSAASWWRTATIMGFVFTAGIVVGVQVSEAMRGGRGAGESAKVVAGGGGIVGGWRSI